MTISINGSGTITGLSAGGLPDSSVTTAEIADANVTPAKLSQKLTSGTAVASTSGTSIDFTDIPSWVKRITVMFSGVSTNGSSLKQVQIGDSGGIETTGYISNAAITGPSSAGTSSTTGFVVQGSAGAIVVETGAISIVLMSGTTWVASGALSREDAAGYVSSMGGKKTLSATLDRVRITTVNGTDTFDAGSINILYE